MQEAKKKKLIVGGTVAAVLLLVILIVFWIGQLISIGVKNRRIEELTAQIAEYEHIRDTSEDALEKYRSLAWLEQAAWLLELYGYEDDVYTPVDNSGDES